MIWIVSIKAIVSLIYAKDPILKLRNCIENNVIASNLNSYIFNLNLLIFNSLAYLSERFLIVDRRAKFAKLNEWSTSPFWWIWSKCVWELIPSCDVSILKEPVREPLAFSSTAISSTVLKIDGFCWCDFTLWYKSSKDSWIR